MVRGISVCSLILTAVTVVGFSLHLNIQESTIPKEQRLFELDDSSFVVGSRSAKRRFFNASNKARDDLSKLAQEHKDLTKKITVLQKPGHYNEGELKCLKRRRLAVEDMTNALRSRALKEDNIAPRSSPIGAGGFADVLLGHRRLFLNDDKNGEQYKYPVAVKISRSIDDADLLLREADFLQSLSKYPGFVKVQHVEAVPTGVAIVLDLLGPSLEDLWWACTCGTGGFSAFTTLKIADGMLQLLDRLQLTGIAHRDIQPANILVGRSREETVSPHLIDFGIAAPMLRNQQEQNKSTMNSNNSDKDAVDIHSVNPPSHPFSGTPRFASVSALSNHGGGNRAADDLESLCYTLAFLRTGTAPWPDCIEEDAYTHEGACKLAAQKASVSPEHLCGKDPVMQLDPAARAICRLMEHARSCSIPKDNNDSQQKQRQQPDYTECRSIVIDAISALSPTNGDITDWEQSGVQWSAQTGHICSFEECSAPPTGTNQLQDLV